MAEKDLAFTSATWDSTAVEEDFRMISQSKNNLRLQAGNADTRMCAAALKTCPQAALGTVTDTVMWTTPLCARITRKHVGGRNGHPEGVS